MKKKVLLELRALTVLPLQKKLREEISLNAHYFIYQEAVGSDPLAFKRVERPKPYGSQNRDYKSIISDSSFLRGNSAAQQRHSEFLEGFSKHHRNFRDFYNVQTKKMKKVHKELTTHHSNEAKRLAQELERQKRARLLALKENDEDAYYKLLQETKNERLNELIAATDSYLENLSQKLALHKTKDDIEEKKKKSSAPKSTQTDQKEEKEEGKDESNKNEDSKSRFERNKQYYSFAHSITETVDAQPKLLIGGILKSYQLIGLQWLVSLYNNKLNGILADEMGLGKTIQTLSLITYLMEKKKNYGPFLITVPLSTISNWQMESKKWAPSVVTVTYTGMFGSSKSFFS